MPIRSTNNNICPNLLNFIYLFSLHSQHIYWSRFSSVNIFFPISDHYGRRPATVMADLQRQWLFRPTSRHRPNFWQTFRWWCGGIIFCDGIFVLLQIKKGPRTSEITKQWTLSLVRNVSGLGLGPTNCSRP